MSFERQPHSRHRFSPISLDRLWENIYVCCSVVEKTGIILATRNRDKALELKALLGISGIQALALNELDPRGKIPEIKETGSTLRENALIKARKILAVSGRPVIADDTGLEVDALDGAPGVYSARYAGRGCTYEDNVKKLLSELERVTEDRRTARFRTVACYVDGTQELWAEGVVEGLISQTPSGDGGFGYDPVFYLPEYGKTYAQLSTEEKNRLSHRGKAMKKLVAMISDTLIPTEYPPL